MRILLVRHAEAVDAEQASSDELRWLTSEGREAMRGVAGTLGELGLRFTHVFTSPLVRSVQTAEILAAQDWFRGTVEVCPALSPQVGTTAQALAPLDELEDGAFVVLVGHMPRIRIMTAHLLGRESFPSFRSGAACLLRWTAGADAAFEWMLDPTTREPIRSIEELQ